jgi:hypothetical protein
MIPVTIAGRKAFLLLNLNSYSSMLTEAAVDLLALGTHSAAINATTKTGETYKPQIATAKEIAIGMAQFENREFIVSRVDAFPWSSDSTS